MQKDIEKAIQEKKFVFGVPGCGRQYGRFYQVLDHWIEVHDNGVIGEIIRQNIHTMNERELILEINKNIVNTENR